MACDRYINQNQFKIDRKSIKNCMRSIYQSEEIKNELEIDRQMISHIDNCPRCGHEKSYFLLGGVLGIIRWAELAWKDSPPCRLIFPIEIQWFL